MSRCMSRLRRLFTYVFLSTSVWTTTPVPAVAATLAVPAIAAAELPADSLYRLPVPLTDSQGRHFKFSDMSGRPTLVTMFYGNCSTACPVVLKHLQDTVAALGSRGNKLAVLLVSLDPMHDSPAGLARLFDTHGIDPQIFRLAVADDEAHTRSIAVALGIKYRTLASGEINHSTRIVLIDSLGRPVTSSSRITGEPDPELLREIRALIGQP